LHCFDLGLIEIPDGTDAADFMMGRSSNPPTREVVLTSLASFNQRKGTMQTINHFYREMIA